MAPSQIVIICPASNENQLYEKLCENDDFLEYRPDPSQKFCSLDEVKQYLPTCSPSAAARGGRPRLARFVAEFSSNSAAEQLSRSIGQEQFGADGSDRVVVVLEGSAGNNNHVSTTTQQQQQAQPQQQQQQQQQNSNNMNTNNRVAPVPVISSVRRERSPEKVQQQQPMQNPLFDSVLGHHEGHSNNNNNNTNNFQQQQQQQRQNFQPQQQQQQQFQQKQQPTTSGAPMGWQQQNQLQFQQNNSNHNNNQHQHQNQNQPQQQESFKVFLGYQPTLQANPPNQYAVSDCIKQNTGINPKQVFVVGHKCAVFVHVGSKDEEDILLTKGTLMLAPHWKFTIKPAFAKKNENINNDQQQQQQHAANPSIPAGFGGGVVASSPQQQQPQQQQQQRNNNFNNNQFNKQAQPSSNQVYASSVNANINQNQTNQATSTILFTSLPGGTTEELLFYRLLPHEPSLIRMIDGTNCAAATFENSENSKTAMDFLQDKTLKGERLTLRYV